MSSRPLSKSARCSSSLTIPSSCRRTSRSCRIQEADWERLSPPGSVKSMDTPSSSMPTSRAPRLAALARLATSGLALVQAEDGTTNALSLPDPSVFAPAVRARKCGTLSRPCAVRDHRDPRARSRRRHGGGPRPLRPASRTSHAVAARSHRVKVVLLSGGGGGARFARGLADTLSPGDLTVVGNVGDDLEILGLHVSPDLDSLLYTLVWPDRRGSRVGPRGRELERARLRRRPGAGRTGSGSAIWTSGSTSCARRLLRAGVPLSDVTAQMVAKAGVSTRILPATDDRLRTAVHTPAGSFPFQEWFVAPGARGRGRRGRLRER